MLVLTRMLNIGAYDTTLKYNEPFTPTDLDEINLFCH